MRGVLLASAAEVPQRRVGMWYEILPSAAITYLGLIIPGIATVYIQRFTNNGKNKRMIRDVKDWQALEREKRISSTGFKGLENID
ncbi:NADH dehydrogenase [ubiquinone] 1 alpha subcomplex subunit 1 [Python bivittatus]|uniref:NADH dehydrogenase [ubiquinone] 1 alpha subcomplex subunit 1 n=1 Tax=Python bivittatus TaxID=176946 RepID=A0A9F2R5H7_PYTBI|nr:NADH dehydrogenase [ubiquinone] 1 alpha subcomplex subunit 1 [Python bivittatus]